MAVITLRYAISPINYRDVFTLIRATMKVINKSLLVFIILLFNTTFVLAERYHANEKVITADAMNKVTAYQLGLKKLKQLRALSGAELQQQLGGISLFLNTIHLGEGGYVTVLEKMDETGQLRFNGVVHVSVVYEE